MAINTSSVSGLLRLTRVINSRTGRCRLLETTAPARAPKSNRRALPRCMHGCSSEMTSTDLVCAPTSSSPATRLVPSLPAAAQPSPRLPARAAAGGDLAVDAELDVPTPCCLRCCQWRSCGCLCRCRWRPCLAALDATGGGRAARCAAAWRVEERWRGPLMDGDDEDEKIFLVFL